MPHGFNSEPTLAGLQQHYGRLSEEYGYAIAIPEGRINMLGYMVMGNDDIARAIEIFELNVEKYPGSANVYDSLAEALESDEQYAAALWNYVEACERGQEIDDPNTGVYERNRDRVEVTIAEMKGASEAEQHSSP
jgi:tetratricopeptide (TPR) repeat protein